MSKPLTIEELKALPAGEWVWLYRPNATPAKQFTYAQIMHIREIDIGLCSRTFWTDFSWYNYGKTWLAYKNKEIAEGKDDEIRKEVAKEIFQELYNLPVCTHQTIGTGQYTFGRKYVKDWAKTKYGVEVDE